MFYRHYIVIALVIAAMRGLHNEGTGKQWGDRVRNPGSSASFPFSVICNQPVC